MYNKNPFNKNEAVGTVESIQNIGIRVSHLENNPPTEIKLRPTAALENTVSQASTLNDVDDIILKPGKHYIIEHIDGYEGYYNFSNLVLESGTAEIHLRFTHSQETEDDTHPASLLMKTFVYPTSWEWIGTTLDDTLDEYTTYVIAVRNEGYTSSGVTKSGVTPAAVDPTGYVAPTVANVAYSYKRELPST